MKSNTLHSKELIIPYDLHQEYIFFCVTFSFVRFFALTSVTLYSGTDTLGGDIYPILRYFFKCINCIYKFS